MPGERASQNASGKRLETSLSSSQITVEECVFTSRKMGRIFRLFPWRVETWQALHLKKMWTISVGEYTIRKSPALTLLSDFLERVQRNHRLGEPLGERLGKDLPWKG
jgi:hypothetical protein